MRTRAKYQRRERVAGSANTAASATREPVDWAPKTGDDVLGRGYTISLVASVTVIVVLVVMAWVSRDIGAGHPGDITSATGATASLSSPVAQNAARMGAAAKKTGLGREETDMHPAFLVSPPQQQDTVESEEERMKRWYGELPSLQAGEFEDQDCCPLGHGCVGKGEPSPHDTDAIP